MSAAAGLTIGLAHPTSELSTCKGSGLLYGFFVSVIWSIDTALSLFVLWICVHVAVLVVPKMFRRRDYSADPEDLDREHAKTLKFLKQAQDGQWNFKRWIYPADGEARPSDLSAAPTKEL